MIQWYLARLCIISGQDARTTRNFWGFYFLEVSKDLTQREQWKWNLVRPLYQKGLTKFDIINLVKFIV
jgi:hypothetical protein